MKAMKRRDRILDMVMWGVMQIYFFFPWIKLEGKRCTIHLYFLRGLQTKDHLQIYKDAFVAKESLKYVTNNTGALADMFWIFTGVLIGLQVLCFLYFIWRFFSERYRTPLLAVQLAIGSVGCAVIWMLGSDESGMWEARRAGVKPPVSAAVNIYVGIYIGLMAVWLLAGVLEGQKSEIAAYQEKERAFKRERKKRLYFPGKYSKLYYRMLWKNLKFRKRDWLLLDLAGIVATAALFVGFGIYQIFSGSYGESHGLLGPGLAETMKDFLVIMTIIMLFMLTSVLIFYRRKRMTDTGLYRLLGIRSRSLRNAWIGEVLICFVTSVVVGLMIGSVCLYLLRLALQSGVPLLGELGTVGINAYLWTVVLMLVISLFAFGFSHEVQSMKESADVRGQAVGSERMPGRHRILIICLVAVPAIYAVIRYGQRRTAENIVVLSIFLLCMFGIMYQMGAVYLDDEKKHKNHYLEHLPFTHMIPYRYQTTIRYLTLFVVIHVCVLFFFTMKFVSNQIATNVENLYPYDYVYLANSGDDEIFQKLEETCGAEIKTFPMIRATTIDNTERLERPGEIPAQQGQNIGISESSYRELKKLAGESYKKELGLDDAGKKVYIVYQQDQGVKAKPIDWYMMEKLPYIHIGQPLLDFNAKQYQKYYPQREIAGEERTSLIGAFRQGKYENLIVFSDQYFDKVKDNWKTEDAYTGEKIAPEDTSIQSEATDDSEDVEESMDDGAGDVEIKEGPTQLVLVNIPKLSKENQATADAIMKEFQKKHAYDEAFDPMVKSVYDKASSVHQRELERLMEEIVSAFVILVLTLVGMLMLHMKVEMELPEMEERYRFMIRIGMREKERLRAEGLEVSRFLWIPLLIAGPLIMLYTIVVFVVRVFKGMEIVHYFMGAVIVWAVYLLIQFLNMKRLQHKVRKRVEVSINER